MIIRDQVDHHMFTFFGIGKLSSQRSNMQTKMCYDYDFLFKTSWRVVIMKSNILYRII